VRGNGKIIQELEAIFPRRWWNVNQSHLGHRLDNLIENDRDGLLVKRMAK